ncbi:MAG: nucleotide exchange factor GrpE [Halobacteriota archaeon]
MQTYKKCSLFLEGVSPIPQDDDLELIEVEIPAEEAALLEELDSVKKQNEEYFSRLQRLQADFENFKRRTKTQSEHLSKYASVELIKELLVISDNLERAAQALRTESNQGISEGIELIHKQLCDILGKNGVTSVKSVGELFDPHLHEAIMTEGDTNLPDNVIIEEIQKGYKLHEKVIRPSKVKVNKSTNKVDR